MLTTKKRKSEVLCAFTFESQHGSQIYIFSCWLNLKFSQNFNTFFRKKSSSKKTLLICFWKPVPEKQNRLGILKDEQFFKRRDPREVSKIYFFALVSSDVTILLQLFRGILFGKRFK